MEICPLGNIPLALAGRRRDRRHGRDGMGTGGFGALNGRGYGWSGRRCATLRNSASGPPEPEQWEWQEWGWRTRAHGRRCGDRLRRPAGANAGVHASQQLAGAGFFTHQHQAAVMLESAGILSAWDHPPAICRHMADGLLETRPSAAPPSPAAVLSVHIPPLGRTRPSVKASSANARKAACLDWYLGKTATDLKTTETPASWYNGDELCQLRCPFRNQSVQHVQLGLWTRNLAQRLTKHEPVHHPPLHTSQVVSCNTLQICVWSPTPAEPRP